MNENTCNIARLKYLEIRNLKAMFIANMKVNIKWEKQSLWFIRGSNSNPGNKSETRRCIVVNHGTTYYQKIGRINYSRNYVRYYVK